MWNVTEGRWKDPNLPGLNSETLDSNLLCSTYNQNELIVIYVSEQSNQEPKLSIAMFSDNYTIKSFSHDFDVSDQVVRPSVCNNMPIFY